MAMKMKLKMKSKSHTYDIKKLKNEKVHEKVLQHWDWVEKKKNSAYKQKSVYKNKIFLNLRTYRNWRNIVLD